MIHNGSRSSIQPLRGFRLSLDPQMNYVGGGGV